jgi:hypothetical protein
MRGTVALAVSGRFIGATRGFRLYRRWTARRRVLPNFLIVGAQRAGTTSLYGYLKQHPQIEASVWKEVHCFDRDSNYSKGVDWYRAHFGNQHRVAYPTGKDALSRLAFEATPAYMHDREAIPRMAELLPEARLIVLLRDPVERAFSNYRNARRKGTVRASFEELIDAERSWIEAGRPLRGVGPMRRFLTRGIYVEQIERIFRFYRHDQVLLLCSEKMFADPRRTCDQALEFLGLPAAPIKIDEIANRSVWEPMNVATRRQLMDFFAPYNRRLFALLQRDFGWPTGALRLGAISAG